MANLSGGCLCGAIRYTSDAAPMFTVVCHCKNCQKQSGSAFSVVVGIPENSFHLSGSEPGVFQDSGETGLPVWRHFCRTCGSPLFTTAGASPGLVCIKTGTLDDTSWLQPEMTVWNSTRQPWVKTDDGLPTVERNPEL